MALKEFKIGLSEQYQGEATGEVARYRCALSSSDANGAMRALPSTYDPSAS